MQTLPCSGRSSGLATGLFLAALLTTSPSAGPPSDGLETVSQKPRIPSFDALLEQPTGLKPGLRGTHPRIFFDRSTLEVLRRRAAENPAAWALFADHASALRTEPPAPPAQERGMHYRVGLALPEPAFAYVITGESAHLARARAWIKAALTYEPWGYTYSKPNQDIPAAFLLYGLSFAYDLLYNDISPSERTAIEQKIAEKAGQLYEYYKPKPGRRYSFSQNHTFINAAALGFVGLALDGHHPDAARWWLFSRAILDRVVRTYSPDGYYYEGYHYFEFSVPWIVHYLDALEFNTGERWYERIRLDLAKYYVAHSLLPDGSAFDFGDIGRGAVGRLKGTIDVLGAHNILYRLSARYGDRDAQEVADWAWKALRLPWREPLWTFVWRATESRGEIDRIPRFYHFKNGGTVFFRTSWTREATAFAFRSGPPEGHHVTSLLEQIPEWRLSTGHAHPDAGSFIIFSKGEYLTGDAGYTGVKMTEHHNTLLIDDRGQENDGRHEVFKDVPYDRLNRIRILEAAQTDQEVLIRADGTAAYPQQLELRQWVRTFRFNVAESLFEVHDTVHAKEARRVTFLLHSDRPIRQESPTAFTLSGNQVALTAHVDAPSSVGALVEPQWVTAQGRPGSVEKGEAEQRGFRLALTAPSQPETSFRVRLTLKGLSPPTTPAPRSVKQEKGQPASQ